jgi:hypothetical protein
MPRLRLLVIAAATICVLALAAFALVNRPAVQGPGDDIIIKGGSIELQCGGNHPKDCLGVPDLVTGKYKKAGPDNKHIMKVTVKLANSNISAAPMFSGNFNANDQPMIIINYR